MSSTSTNLSDRIFMTLVWTDGTAYIGELDITKDKKGHLQQKTLVRFTSEELENLTRMLIDHKESILYTESEEPDPEIDFPEVY